jgi:hypothetical protein
MLVTWSALAAAGEAESRFMVTASVVPAVRLEAVDEPGSILVTERDLERGFVEFESTYRVRSNHPDGFLLHLHPLPGYDRSLSVVMSDGEWRLTGPCTELLQPAALESRDQSLRVRMALDRTARPGVLPVPLQVLATTF